METLKKYTRENSEIVIEFNTFIEIAVSSLPLKLSSSLDGQIHIFLEGETSMEKIFEMTNNEDGIVISDLSWIHSDIGNISLNVEIPNESYMNSLTIFIRKQKNFIGDDTPGHPKCTVNLSSKLDELFVSCDVPVEITGLIPRVVCINGGLSKIDIYGDLSSKHTFLNLETHTGDISVNINRTKKYTCTTSYVYKNDKSKKQDTLRKDGSYDMDVHGIIRTNSGAIILT